MCKAIPQAPVCFSGTLGDLYSQGAMKVLLPVDAVEVFHRDLVTHCHEVDPHFLVRKVADQERGHMLRTTSGGSLIPTDNAPAWWIHHMLFFRRRSNFSSFRDFISAVPCHMFEIRESENVNRYGWHVAHIFNAKDRDTNWSRWDRKELIRRMVRNIHPCNYFYIPKTDWRSYGGHPSVLAFFADQFRGKYHSIWSEFLELAQAEMPIVPHDCHAYPYTLPAQPIDGARPTQIMRSDDSSRVVASYHYSRLAFKAAIIEPLDLDNVFTVSTPVGTFRMTKRQFYAEFPRVVASSSYRDKGLYHFPKVPEHALRFLVDK